MTTTGDAGTDAGTADVDLRLEAVVIPVADVERAKTYYSGLGWRLDADFSFDDGFRVVQFTPPGSGCSVQFGTNITTADPGTAQGLYLIVSDIDSAGAELVAQGADITGVFHPERQEPSSVTSRPTAGWMAPRSIAAATTPLPRSPTRTATRGCSRR